MRRENWSNLDDLWHRAAQICHNTANQISAVRLKSLKILGWVEGFEPSATGTTRRLTYPRHNPIPQLACISLMK